MWAPPGGQEAPKDEAAFSGNFAQQRAIAGAAAHAGGHSDDAPCRHACDGMPDTERLHLRRWRTTDREPFAALNADPEVVRYIGDGSPMTRAESDDLLNAIDAHWAQHGFGLWCAAPREDPQACLGFVGLAVPSFLPSVMPAVEVGWRLARPAWGRGLATEGAQAAVRHAFESLGLESVISVIDPDNDRSVRVAEKLGMRRGAAHVHPATGRRLHAYEISSHDAGFSPGRA
jgi:RimJ/RimL family protein N-acetyltransferase